MRTIYLAIAGLVVLFFSVMAAANMMLPVVHGVPDSGSDPCSGLNYTFLYTADHPTSNVYACISGGTMTGTLNSATIVSTANHTVGGTYSVSAGANNYYISFPVTATQIGSAEGWVSVWAYPVTSLTGNFTLFEYYYDSDNYINAYYFHSLTRIYFTIRSAATTYQIIVTGVSISADTFTNYQFKWHAGNDLMAVQYAGGAWDEQSKAFAAFSTEPSALLFGELNSGNNGQVILIDDAELDTSYSAH